jgi:aminoglycoside 6'-N-acetyltransferase
VAARADRLGGALAGPAATVGFRPLARSDFARLARWLETPHVARWWAHETTTQALERDFGACIDGAEPTDVFVVRHGPHAIGLLQRYRLADYASYAEALSALLPVPDDAWGIDYFVGEPQLLGRGLGAATIRAALAALWRERREASAVIVPVHATNLRSRRALERAGFRVACHGLLEPDNAADDRAHVVYRIDRPCAAAGTTGR